ncbi:MAG TPA: adenylate kinase [Nocardioidaceae bacterium]|nr:adenylate kinase [Nocardioidaceae bacterium]
MRVVLVGPPGAGKGTQAEHIAKHYRIPNISTGDIFRANVVERTSLGEIAKSYMDEGELVPDDVTVAMVRDRLGKDDTDHGFLLDGFPRTVPQAESLGALLDELDVPLDVVLKITVDDDEVVRRLSGRRICRSCGRTFHVEFDPPSKEDVCDVCGGDLYQRDDDKPETVRRRLQVYREQTKPLVEYYEERGLLRRVMGTGEVTEVTKRAIEALEQPTA